MKNTQWVKHKQTYKNTKSDTPSDRKPRGDTKQTEGKKRTQI